MGLTCNLVEHCGVEKTNCALHVQEQQLIDRFNYSLEATAILFLSLDTTKNLAYRLEISSH